MLTKLKKLADGTCEVTGKIDAVSGSGADQLAYFSMPHTSASWGDSDLQPTLDAIQELRTAGFLKNGSENQRSAAGKSTLIRSNFTSLTVPLGSDYGPGDSVTMVFEKTKEGPVKLVGARSAARPALEAKP